VSTLNTILFYFFSALAVGSAIVMITRRNVVHAAIFLVTTLLATAGIFSLLQAELVFALQVFLYAGGIAALFVFVIALRAPVATPRPAAEFGRSRIVGTALATVLAAQMLFAIVAGRTTLRLPTMHAVISPRNTQAIGDALFHQFAVPFELTSVLLLVSMIGAVVLARRRA